MNNEQSPEPATGTTERRRRAGGVVVGAAAFLAVGAMLFGPNTLQSYQDAQDIKHKSDPATEYATQVLGRITLDGKRITREIGRHSCTRGARYLPGYRDRYCSVTGKAVYVLNQQYSNTFDAYAYVMETLRTDGIESLNDDGTAKVTVEGQTLDVSSGVNITDAVTYNNRLSFERNENDPVLPPGGFLITFDVAAYTVFRAGYNDNYPYNNDGP